MRLRTGCIVLIITIFFQMSLLAQMTLEENRDIAFNRACELHRHMMNGVTDLDFSNILQTQTTTMNGKKKLFIGILLSAVVPGTGEFYAGSWIKGAIFLGVEAALWVGYAQYTDEGQEWEDTFHGFANTHWSEPDYWVDLASHVGITGVTTENYDVYLDQLRQAESDLSHYTHSLPETKTQQYFEMIGKYDQFKAGWDDWEEGDPALTPNRDYYEEIRHESNVQFKRASYCAMLALGNRLLSVFDTAWTIRRINRRVEGKMRVSLMRTGDTYSPCLVLNFNW